MNDKIIFTCNSHQTYDNAFKFGLKNALEKHRHLTFSDAEFISYNNNNLQIIIDSKLTIFITSSVVNGDLDIILQDVHSEIEFLSQLDYRIDIYGKIEVSIPKNTVLFNCDKYDSNMFDEVIYLSV